MEPRNFRGDEPVPPSPHGFAGLRSLSIISYARMRDNSPPRVGNELQRFPTASNSLIFGTESGTMSVPLELEGYHLKYGKLDEAGAGGPRAANGKATVVGMSKYMSNIWQIDSCR